MKLLTKFAMEKRVPVASKKSTYRKVISASHRSPLAKLLKLQQTTQQHKNECPAFEAARFSLGKIKMTLQRPHSC